MRKISAVDKNPEERPASAIRFNQNRSRKRFFQTKKRYEEDKKNRFFFQDELLT